MSDINRPEGFGNDFVPEENAPEENSRGAQQEYIEEPYDEGREQVEASGSEVSDAAYSEPEEGVQFEKRQARRKRKRMVWSAVKLAISAVICIPLIFFCFWAGTKLFFPGNSEITGLKEKYARKANKDFVISLEVTNPEERDIELQRLDEENGKWITEAKYETGFEDKEKVKIEFPETWTDYTYSKWRLHMDRTFGVKKVTTEPFNVTCRNRGNVKFKCSAALVYCVDNKEVLYDVHMNKELPNASTTKMITAILAIEKGNMDDVVTFSHRAVMTPYAYFGIHTGYKFYLKDLMKGMMIQSGNECATAIGEHVGGSYEKFRNMMNKRAKELGCKHTHFVTPSGLDAYGHYSTAYDLALINAKAIEYDEYNKLMLMEKATLKNLNKDDEWEYELKPSNDLLKEHIKGYMGGKTGTTAQAGNCLSSAYKYNGKTYILVVMNAGDRFKTTKTLMKYVRKYA